MAAWHRWWGAGLIGLVVAAGLGGCAKSGDEDIAVGGGTPTVTVPAITTQPVSQTAAVGGSASFTVAASGNGLALQWFLSTTGGLSWVAISGANQASYTVNPVDATMNGQQFRVVVQNPLGTATSSAAVLTVAGASGSPPTISAQPLDSTVASGQAGSFAVQASGGGGVRYQWARNGVAIDGATQAAYSTPATLPADHGASYTVVVTAGNGGTTTSRVATLHVLQASASRAVALAAGGSHSLALRSDGSVWAWGDNRQAQLARPAQTLAYTPTPMPVAQASGAPLDGVTAVAAGATHSLAVRNDGTLWGWGKNDFGKLGSDSAVTERALAVPALDASGAVFGNVVQAGAGVTTSAALRRDGTVWVWGWDAVALPLLGARPVAVADVAGTPLSGVTRIALVFQMLVMLKADGTVWAWGWHGAGNGLTTPYAVPVETADGVALRGIVDIAASGSAGVAVAGDGRAYTWGGGWLGRDASLSARRWAGPVLAADGAPVTGIAQAVSGRYHVVLQRADGTLLAFGGNSGGGLSVNTNNLEEPRPLAVKLADGTVFSGVTAIALAEEHTLLLRTDGSVWGWGSNSAGQLARNADSLFDRTFRNPVAINF